MRAMAIEQPLQVGQVPVALQVATLEQPEVTAVAALPLSVSIAFASQFLKAGCSVVKVASQLDGWATTS